MMLDIYEKLVKMIKSGQSGTLVTVTEVSGSVPRHSGSKMIVRPDGSIIGSIGGGKIEKEAIELALSSESRNGNMKKSFTLTEDHGLLCGGTIELLFEPFGGLDQLIIFGAGHIGQALHSLGKKAGFRVVVVDNRPEFADERRLPEADQIVASDYESAIQHIEFTDRSFLVIVTHGHQFDELILHRCIQKPSFYIGMIGSRRKVAAVFKKLKEKGVPAGQLDAVYAPVGLKIGAETPFEIAISILAEIIAVRQHVSVETASMKLK